ncbi:uncharacterized protein MONOS_7607 [Monocercomonoides exilis]|uniref:uncharacterized protein n=1 Tax=Monocercomonoides exilis TaxID=2049356 RepID=UPI00355956A4|nr:hypothetical protein MONOS_7607 [Monocercomonoides exilis]|eukprot:MONOS_7607.1-p1 / transcript=MONOS_7607.1 / gene=MONOS_7607 / organism=Monocercomonoides_exilis_PA203 / gene_product=unspecified product / transcript_product=unspecified product / location=Mono_scaffold00264:35367-39527(+) / protein_length=1366 / sequence_SO=supercontig / SO=protein_coding / is_pseudo=false
MVLTKIKIEGGQQKIVLIKGDATLGSHKSLICQKLGIADLDGYQIYTEKEDGEPDKLLSWESDSLDSLGITKSGSKFVLVRQDTKVLSSTILDNDPQTQQKQQEKTNHIDNAHDNSSDNSPKISQEIVHPSSSVSGTKEIETSPFASVSGSVKQKLNQQQESNSNPLENEQELIRQLSPSINLSQATPSQKGVHDDFSGSINSNLTGIVNEENQHIHETKQPCELKNSELNITNEKLPATSSSAIISSSSNSKTAQEYYISAFEAPPSEKDGFQSAKLVHYQDMSNSTITSGTQNISPIKQSDKKQENFTNTSVYASMPMSPTSVSELPREFQPISPTSRAKLSFSPSQLAVSSSPKPKEKVSLNERNSSGPSTHVSLTPNQHSSSFSVSHQKSDNFAQSTSSSLPKSNSFPSVEIPSSIAPSLPTLPTSPSSETNNFQHQKRKGVLEMQHPSDISAQPLQFNPLVQNPSRNEGNSSLITRQKPDEGQNCKLKSENASITPTSSSSPSSSTSSTSIDYSVAQNTSLNISPSSSKSACTNVESNETTVKKKKKKKKKKIESNKNQSDMILEVSGLRSNIQSISSASTNSTVQTDNNFTKSVCKAENATEQALPSVFSFDFASLMSSVLPSEESASASHIRSIGKERISHSRSGHSEGTSLRESQMAEKVFEERSIGKSSRKTKDRESSADLCAELHEKKKETSANERDAGFCGRHKIKENAKRKRKQRVHSFSPSPLNSHSHFHRHSSRSTSSSSINSSVQDDFLSEVTSSDSATANSRQLAAEIRQLKTEKRKMKEKEAALLKQLKEMENTQEKMEKEIEYLKEKERTSSAAMEKFVEEMNAEKRRMKAKEAKMRETQSALSRTLLKMLSKQIQKIKSEQERDKFSSSSEKEFVNSLITTNSTQQTIPSPESSEKNLNRSDRKEDVLDDCSVDNLESTSSINHSFLPKAERVDDFDCEEKHTSQNSFFQKSSICAPLTSPLFSFQGHNPSVDISAKFLSDQKLPFSAANSSSLSSSSQIHSSPLQSNGSFSSSFPQLFSGALHTPTKMDAPLTLPLLRHAPHLSPFPHSTLPFLSSSESSSKKCTSPAGGPFIANSHSIASLNSNQMRCEASQRDQQCFSSVEQKCLDDSISNVMPLNSPSFHDTFTRLISKLETATPVSSPLRQPLSQILSLLASSKRGKTDCNSTFSTNKLDSSLEIDGPQQKYDFSSNLSDPPEDQTNEQEIIHHNSSQQNEFPVLQQNVKCPCNSQTSTLTSSSSSLSSLPFQRPYIPNDDIVSQCIQPVKEIRMQNTDHSKYQLNSQTALGTSSLSHKTSNRVLDQENPSDKEAVNNSFFLKAPPLPPSIAEQFQPEGILKFPLLQSISK